MKERPCWRCHKEKPWDDENFPLGRSGKRRTPICFQCLEVWAYELEAKKTKYRATWIDPKTNHVVRRCHVCHEVKDLEDDFYGHAKARRGSKYKRNYVCKPCADKRAKARSLRNIEHTRALKRAAVKREREKFPERTKACRKRYRERIKANPMSYARMLEDARINYRLRRERAGRPVVKRQKPNIKQPKYGLRRVPAPLLVEFIDRRSNGKDITRVCKEYGIEPRTLYSWRTGTVKHAKVDVVEKVLCSTNTNWRDIYPEEFAPIFEGP